MNSAALTRRAVIGGALAALPMAACAFSTDEAITMEADRTISLYTSHGVSLIPQHSGWYHKVIYVDGGMTEQEEAVVTGLDERVKHNPALRRRIDQRLRQMYKL